MWLVLTRAPLPDAPYWPGRPLLGLFDAVAWPVAWPAGIVGPLIIALAVLSALGRAHRAALQNHRYHFTTWRWGCVLTWMLAVGALLKLGLPA